MKPQALVFILVALLAFGAGTYLAMKPKGISGPGDETQSRGYVLDEPRPLPAFQLVDEKGISFSETDFEDQWSLLYFGFTYCPDICPSAMAVMAQIKQGVDSQAPLENRYYLVSVDPERDTPERIGEYVSYFDPEFHGLTGDFAQLDIITRAAGAVYKVPEAPENDDYLVAHSSTLTLIDPQGRVHAIFTSPFDPVRIAADISQIHDRFRY